MARKGISRQLAVLVHADVAGSTTLVQRDETLAHARINSTFMALSSIVRDYGGIVHEIRGDALVAEFARASDAVCAALLFQESNERRNTALEDAIKPGIRIGVSLGEVVFAHGTVTGAGIVLAQRVEQLAPAGGVCITAAIREALPHRMPFRQEYLGERELRGFDDAVRIYRVTCADGAEIPPPERSSAVRRSRRRRLIALAAVTGLVVAGGGAATWWLTARTSEQPRPSVTTMPAPQERRSIAVLPFDNLSRDPDQEFFSDGMTDDLITELSKLGELFVISRNSTFVFKNQAVNIQAVADELGVQYVLEGSVRRASGRVRINAQLIDGRTGGHIWADRYDEELADVFSLQDRVTRQIVSALKAELMPDAVRRSNTGGTDVVTAYDAFLKGRALQVRKTPQDSARALELFSDAVALDPDYSRAYVAIAQIYWEHDLDTEFNQLIGRPVDHSLVDHNSITSWEYLQKAGDTPFSTAHAIKAHMLQRQRRFPEALREARTAVELGPSDPVAYDALIENLIYAGEVDEALRHIDESIGLDPSRPGEKLFLRALAHYASGRLDESIVAVERARAHNPGQARYLVIHATALAELGLVDAAVAVFEEFRTRWTPFATVNYITYRWPFQQRRVAERLSASLLQVGAIPPAQSITTFAKERLKTQEIRSLLANRLMRGFDRGPYGAETDFEVARDGEAQIVSQGFVTYFDPSLAPTVIRDDLLCDPWWTIGTFCVAVFPNQSGSRDRSSEYVFFTLTGPFTFSVYEPNSQ